LRGQADVTFFFDGDKSTFPQTRGNVCPEAPG
jgi:hypothetical protein